MRLGPAPSRPPAPTVHSLPLLDALLRDSLDPAYAEATARKHAAEARGETVRHSNVHLLAVLGVLLVALVAGLAIGQQRASAPDAAKARANLIKEIKNRTSLIEFLTKAESALRGDISVRRDALLKDSRAGSSLAAQIRDLDAATGATTLKGAGIVVRMSDAKQGQNGTAGGGQEGRIQDRDIQEVVNQLWASGAKGIAINGIRLTAQTAIRTAGDAILVDFRAQSSPYVIDVVGDEDLQGRFQQSAVAQRFDAWSQLYGLGFQVTHDHSVTLPAAAPTAPRHATATAPLPSKSSAPRASSTPSP